MQKLTYFLFFIGLIALVYLLPRMSEAVETTLTLNRLEKAYAARSAAIATELAVAEAALAAEHQKLQEACLATKKRNAHIYCAEVGNETTQQLGAQIASLKGEQQYLPYTVNLLKAALQ